MLQVYSSSTPLRVGYYDTDGYFPLPPCMRRAVKETRRALQAAGHQVSTTTPCSSPQGVPQPRSSLRKSPFRNQTQLPSPAVGKMTGQRYGIRLPQPRNTRQRHPCLGEQCISQATSRNNLMGRWLDGKGLKQGFSWHMEPREVLLCL